MLCKCSCVNLTKLDKSTWKDSTVINQNKCGSSSYLSYGENMQYLNFKTVD